jgi:hypothetical protein
LIARPEKRKTTEAPTSAPTEVLGDTIEVERLRLAKSASILRRVDRRRRRLLTASVNEPNSAVAASTAVAIAMPLVMAFVVLPTASRLGEDLRPSPVDVAGHLGDALGVVRDRAEGVHRDDDADRGEQPTAGEGDEGRAPTMSTQRPSRNAP